MDPSSTPFTASYPWEQERARLVALCRAITGDATIAEDLAQETLYEAWRHLDRLGGPSGLTPWLAAIARNMCLRWRAQVHRAALHQLSADLIDADDGLALVDPFEMSALVEQAETRQLLMRALALLPADMRDALIAHCVDGASFAQIARRQGVAEATVKMRVQRGKRRLRHSLSSTFVAEATACGLLEQSGAAWLATPLWCPRCGQRHLEGQWDFAVGTLRLQCRACLSTTGIYSTYEGVPELFRGVTSLKAGFNRVMRWVNTFYMPTLQRGGTTCDCGQFVPIIHHLPHDMPGNFAGMQPEHYHQMRGLHLHCPTCDGTASMCLTNLALYTPPAWHFWSEQRRIRTLPEQAVQFAGQPALRLSFQAMSSAAQLDVFVDRATYAIIAIH